MKRMNPEEVLEAVKDFIDDDIDLSYMVTITINGKESGVSYKAFVADGLSEDLIRSCDESLIKGIVDSLKREIKNMKFKHKIKGNGGS